MKLTKEQREQIYAIIYDGGESFICDAGVDAEQVEMTVKAIEEILAETKTSFVRVEEQNDLFYIMLYAPDGQNNVCLEQRDDIETKEGYDDLLEKAKQHAEFWEIELQIDITKEEYFGKETSN